MNGRSSSGSRWYQLVVKDLLELQHYEHMCSGNEEKIAYTLS